MEQFISQAATSLGLDEGVVGNATGTLLGILKEQGEGSAVGSLLDKLPGAEALMASASDAAAGGGGDLMGAASSMLGGKLGGAAGMLGQLSSTGLDTSQLASLGEQFVGYAKAEAGEDAVAGALDSAPQLKALLG